ncbi:hypothetical protein MKEN_00746800 [Mycena kentingensis (nom. inval.)]|nr:hypothetical protein MKEN_00746800 [Mycena kentingensis (nom. inval.)]
MALPAGIGGFRCPSEDVKSSALLLEVWLITEGSMECAYRVEPDAAHQCAYSLTNGTRIPIHDLTVCPEAAGDAPNPPALPTDVIAFRCPDTATGTAGRSPCIGESWAITAKSLDCSYGPGPGRLNVFCRYSLSNGSHASNNDAGCALVANPPGSAPPVSSQPISGSSRRSTDGMTATSNTIPTDTPPTTSPSPIGGDSGSSPAGSYSSSIIHHSTSGPVSTGESSLTSSQASISSPTNNGVRGRHNEDTPKLALPLGLTCAALSANQLVPRRQLKATLGNSRRLYQAAMSAVLMFTGLRNRWPSNLPECRCAA